LDNNEILLIHLGGLGDVCLSESLFLSFQKQFDDSLVGLGNKRFLDLFQEYFKRVEGVESRKWLYLFSEKLDGPRWRQIIFIGKDRKGILRNRWQVNSEEKIIFIDMYPENAFERVCGSTLSRQKMQGEALSSQGEREGVAPMALPLEGATRAPVVEDYQLGQLTPYSVEPLKKKIPCNKSQRVILYPEKGFEKEKWHHDNFIDLYHSLKAHDVDVILLGSLGLSVNVDNKVFLEDLTEIKQFFSEGGIFVSNDSGMAHLAGSSGLFTFTIFTGFDPAIWHPRGRNLSLTVDKNPVDVGVLENNILEILKGF
jgi:ADP-heptose:LPS heptosyltransferase